ncbi:mitochondrial carnitine/acylcarnitine carrier protein-like [Dendronephthya gigantea]|uniref:mitochondrial carnitine/acylcarnitine carrier protein-like n=1 Tax=Dendronephthya gigantea TaxID=151771 RepID=UPI00106BF549|nr:mitochondrial carnitine/acylcarnitine carrier protein-like [Dendronephthya gigantea]
MAEDMESKDHVSSSALKNFLAGGVGGIALVFAGHPLDTIKVRLQTQPKVAPGELPQFAGTLDCAKKTVVKEGFRGLYKGMATPIFLATPMCAMFFLGSSIGKRLQQPQNPNGELSNIQHFKAGMVAAVFATTVMVPADRIKCLLQIQQTSPEKAKYKGPLDCAWKIFKETGIKGLYKGTAATLLRDIPGNGVYFMTYEIFLKLMTSEGESRADIGPLRIFVAGGFAGMMGWIPGIAPDSLKSRLQTAPEGTYPKGLRDVFRYTIREEGPKALFKGLTPVMLRAFPANAACFLGFEMALRFFNWISPSW